MLQQQPTLWHQLADWLRAWEERTLVNQRHTRGATGRSWRGCTWNVKGTRGCSRGSIQEHWSIGLCNAQHWHTETAKGANTTMPHGSLNTFTGCKLKYLYNQRHTGLLWWLVMHPASCTVWSERITANSLCRGSVCVRVSACVWVCSERICTHVCSSLHIHTRTHTPTQAYTSPHYPSTPSAVLWMVTVLFAFI